MIFAEAPDNTYFQLESSSPMWGEIYIKRRGFLFQLSNHGLIATNIPDAHKVRLLNEGIIVKTRLQDEYDSIMAAG